MDKEEWKLEGLIPSWRKILKLLSILNKEYNSFIVSGSQYNMHINENVKIISLFYHHAFAIFQNTYWLSNSDIRGFLQEKGLEHAKCNFSGKRKETSRTRSWNVRSNSFFFYFTLIKARIDSQFFFKIVIIRDIIKDWAPFSVWF